MSRSKEYVWFKNVLKEEGLLPDKAEVEKVIDEHISRVVEKAASEIDVQNVFRQRFIEASQGYLKEAKNEIQKQIKELVTERVLSRMVVNVAVKETD